MTTDPIDRVVVPATPAAGASPATAARAGEPSPTFRRLLESLEELVRRQPRPPEVQDADTLKTALERADDDFRQVMDLRRRLEAAFRDRP